MKISDISFSDYEISQLKEFRDKQKNGKLKIRFMVLLMLSAGSRIDQVLSVAGYCKKQLGIGSEYIKPTVLKV